MKGERPREVDDRLADWVDGCMTERDRARFVAELRVNPQLRKDLADYEHTVQAIRAALRAPTTPVDLGDRILQAVAQQSKLPVAFASRPGWRAWLLGLGAAAALLATAMWLDSWQSHPERRQVADAPAGAKELGEQPGQGGRSDDAMAGLAVQPPASAAPASPPPAPAAPKAEIPTEHEEHFKTGAEAEKPGAVMSRSASGDPGSAPIGGRDPDAPKGESKDKQSTPERSTPEQSTQEALRRAPAAAKARLEEQLGDRETKFADRAGVPVPSQPLVPEQLATGAAAVPSAPGAPGQVAGASVPAPAPPASRGIATGSDDFYLGASRREAKADDLEQRTGGAAAAGGNSLPRPGGGRGSPPQDHTAEPPVLLVVVTARAVPAKPPAQEPDLRKQPSESGAPPAKLLSEFFASRQVATPALDRSSVTAPREAGREPDSAPRAKTVEPTGPSGIRIVTLPPVAESTERGNTSRIPGTAGGGGGTGGEKSADAETTTSEQEWLVEGNRAEVGELLRALTSFASERGYEVGRGEVPGQALRGRLPTAGPVGAAPQSVPSGPSTGGPGGPPVPGATNRFGAPAGTFGVSRPTGADGGAPAADTVRVLVRLRLPG